MGIGRVVAVVVVGGRGVRMGLRVGFRGAGLKVWGRGLGSGVGLGG